MLIHERSLGVPRTVSVMCDNALLSAFALGRQPVDREIVLEVSRDFDLHGRDGALFSTSQHFGDEETAGERGPDALALSDMHDETEPEPVEQADPSRKFKLFGSAPR